jgi:hypothetical protein
MTSTEKRQDHSQQVAADSLTTCPQALVWLDRLNVRVGQWPQNQAAGRRLLWARGVPSNQTTLSQAYRTIIGYFNTVGLKSKHPTPSSARGSLNVAADGPERPQQPARRPTEAVSRS